MTEYLEYIYGLAQASPNVDLSKLVEISAHTVLHDIAKKQNEATEALKLKLQRDALLEADLSLIKEGDETGVDTDPSNDWTPTTQGQVQGYLFLAKVLISELSYLF